MSLFVYYLWMVLVFWDVWDERRGPVIELMSWVAAPYLTVMFVFYANKFMRNWGAVFSATAEGIHDVRITETVVPWSEIETLSLTNGYFARGIRVTLKPGTTLKKFGAPGGMPFFLLGRRPSASSFFVAGSLERNPAGIANDINGFSHTSALLKVKRE